MNKRILELELENNPHKKERLVLEEFMDEFVSIYNETYQTYSWQKEDWYSSPDEGVLIPKSCLSQVIDALSNIK